VVGVLAARGEDAGDVGGGGALSGVGRAGAVRGS
jgi:hypothetical protein